MTLQERQKREIEALTHEIDECENDHRKLCHADMVGMRNALEQVKSDPETYFKNIDEQE